MDTPSTAHQPAANQPAADPLAANQPADNLVARIEHAAGRGGSITFVAGDDHVTVPWSQVFEEAAAMAAALQARGIGRGSHVALLGPTTRHLVTAIEAVWLSGATLMVLPLPMRLASLDEFVRATRVRLAKGDVSLVLADPDVFAFVTPEPSDPPFVTFPDLAAAGAQLGAERWERPDVRPDDLAVLQFTSGSTSEPKGVVLHHSTICANHAGIRQVTSLDITSDVIVSWLPLYHDMGLVGLYGLSVTSGNDLVQGAPQDFMSKPLRWMEWVSRYRGTATAGPNFAWVLATRALRRAGTLDLSRLRVALSGAEPVDPVAVRAFVDAAAPFGFRPGAIYPAFGMAEVAIAGTFPEPMAGLQTDTVNQRVLETDRYAAEAAPGSPGSRELVKLGRAIPGLEIRAVDVDSGSVCGDREVGELQIRGTSVMPGYYKNPEVNALTFDGEWMRTGDLAYVVDGQLVICGRIKDVIILGGRNIFPDDVERAAGEVDGVRAGNVVAFGVDGPKGKEHLVVVAETKEPASRHEELRHGLHHRALEVAGAPPHDVVLVQAGTVPKTSSGKLQRSLCKRQYLAGELELVPTA